MLRVPGETLGISEALSPQGLPHSLRRRRLLTRLISEFSWKFKHLEGAANRRKPQILAEHRCRLGSVTLGPSPLGFSLALDMPSLFEGRRNCVRQLVKYSVGACGCCVMVLSSLRSARNTVAKSTGPQLGPSWSKVFSKKAKIKGQQLKGKIVSALFHFFRVFQNFSSRTFS